MGRSKPNLIHNPSFELEDQMEVSVVVPVYNEQHMIKETIDTIKESFKGSEIRYEIIAVEDGSSDDTWEVLSAIEDIIIIRNKKNSGYGYSIKKGMKVAKYKNIFITDADGTYPNERMPEFVRYFHDNNLDMLVGRRDRKNIPLIRRPPKAFLRKFASYISGFDIPDLNSGFRMFRKDYAIAFSKMLPDGFSLTSTITLSFFSEKLDIDYVPIKYGKREGKSKIRPIKDTMAFFHLIWKTVFYFNPLKIFLPLSILLFLSALGIFSYSFFKLEKVMDITTIVLLLTSVQIFCIGLVADLIVKRGNI